MLELAHWAGFRFRVGPAGSESNQEFPAAPEYAASGLASLQKTVKNEGAELRQIVTDLRPLRVQSADLVDLMRGFAERYRNESTVALDLLIDSAQLRAPDRVCREIFQI